LDNLRSRAKSLLKRVSLLSAAREVRRWMMLAISAAFRNQEYARRLEFTQVKERHAEGFSRRLNELCGRPKAMVVSIGSVDGVKTELGLIKGLELAGFTPVVLTPQDRWLIKYYELARVDSCLFREDYLGQVDSSQVGAVVSGVRSLEDLLACEYAGVRVGRFAASTALRKFRVGSLDFGSREIRERLMPFVASSMNHTVGAQEIIRTVRPKLVLFVDRGYTPVGELFDICLANGIDVITWNAAHKNNAIMVKRYTLENRDEHPASLAEASWQGIRGMEWTDGHRQHLHNELSSCYASGEWYSEVGTQFNTRLLKADEIHKRFGLKPEKKTAVIFPHILWDGTFFWGRDLFGSYEEWFVETVRAACVNDRVNWLIKVHPANIVKSLRDGFHGEHSEIKVIRERIGHLPDHVVIIPADSDVNTFSLFSLMGYCLTVRGTVGVEAASFGIPVLTAGTGRYDHRGFTIDSESRAEYLARIADIHEIPPLSPVQRALAERFAYAVFVLRPLSLQTVTLEYQRDSKATPRARINALTREDWLNAPDLKAFADWVADPAQVDFLTGDHGRSFGG